MRKILRCGALIFLVVFCGLLLTPCFGEEENDPQQVEVALQVQATTEQNLIAKENVLDIAKNKISEIRMIQRKKKGFLSYAGLKISSTPSIGYKFLGYYKSGDIVLINPYLNEAPSINYYVDKKITAIESEQENAGQWGTFSRLVIFIDGEIGEDQAIKNEFPCVYLGKLNVDDKNKTVYILTSIRENAVIKVKKSGATKK